MEHWILSDAEGLAALITLMVSGVLIVGILFIGVPWLILHFITQWRKSNALSADDERMLSDIWQTAKKMETRIEALEKILDAQDPDWRKAHG
jgi:phage shock protein B